jgi:hypothetical protein
MIKKTFKAQFIELKKERDKYHDALKKISDVKNIKEDVRDYANIGKNAIYTATEALKARCPECGK